MAKLSTSVGAALRGGSRGRNFARRISDVCACLDETGLTDDLREEIIRLAAACRASKEVATILSMDDLPAIDEIPEFHDLLNETYYPVLEDGKRTVGFWSVKDAATLSPDDVHEWVRDTKLDEKTKQMVVVPVSFSSFWKKRKPDYELFGVVCDRSMWSSKVVTAEDGRRCVNTAYGRPPVRMAPPVKYGDGKDAGMVLDAILRGTITDDDEHNAMRKRVGFVLDAGGHLLAMRDFGEFRCRKIFCFTSTNAGQGTGKSLLHESLSSLVPQDASVCIPTTALAGNNLLPLYASTVCVLTEAPSTSSERYTAEDVKAFADAGWKTAEEKYVAKRAVRDNSLKLLSSNHMAPLPIDSPLSRRIEFFRAAECGDGGQGLRAMLDEVQERNGWSQEELRRCVGWALLCRAEQLIAAGAEPVAVARRSIGAAHLLSMPDYEFLVTNCGNQAPSYADYKEFRNDNGITWSPNMWRFNEFVIMSKSVDEWLNGMMPPAEMPDGEPDGTPDGGPDRGPDGGPDGKGDGTHVEAAQTAPVASVVRMDARMQFKPRMATAYLEQGLLTLRDVYDYVVKDEGLRLATEAVRNGTGDKRRTLRQVFPGVRFEKFTRRANIVGFNGLTHIDFDKVSQDGNGATVEQVRDTLSKLPGFVMAAVSSGGDGVWAIFYAGDQVVDVDTYDAAQRALAIMAEEAVCMRSDSNILLPTAGRTLGHDRGCLVAKTVLDGGLPEPFVWQAPRYRTANVRLSGIQPSNMTVADRARNERFLEAVVDRACESIQTATEGDRHNAAIRGVANVALSCKERGITPLVTWGQRLLDACLLCGIGKLEARGIMDYWAQQTGVRV